MGYLTLLDGPEPSAFPAVVHVPDIKAPHQNHSLVARRRRNTLFPSGVKLCAQETAEQVVGHHLSFFHLRGEVGSLPVGGEAGGWVQKQFWGGDRCEDGGPQQHTFNRIRSPTLWSGCCVQAKTVRLVNINTEPLSFNPGQDKWNVLGKHSLSSSLKCQKRDVPTLHERFQAASWQKAFHHSRPQHLCSHSSQLHLTG